MGFVSAYASRVADPEGRIAYTEVDDAVWRALIARQAEVLPGRAAPEVLEGLERLELPATRVPQVAEVHERLMDLSRFGVEPVPAMISEAEFFELLAQRRFPVATFVRRPDELDYLQEPDVFHEVFGHGPLLTEPRFADAVERFGRAARLYGPPAFEALHRLFWFTVEFGLLATQGGLRIYGAGIGSSPLESVHALESEAVERRPFDPAEIVAAPYRIDALQRRYYVVDGLEDFYALAERLESDLPRWMRRAA